MQTHQGIDLPVNRRATLVGSKACLVCHQYKSVQTVYHSAHRGVMDNKHQGCESCHGAGSRHSKNPQEKGLILNPSNLPNNKQIRLCQECHSQPGWRESAHAQNYLTCQSCHAIHQQSEHGLLNKDVFKLCSQCHPEDQLIKEMPVHKELLLGEENSCVGCHLDLHTKEAAFLKKEYDQADCLNCHVLALRMLFKRIENL